MHIIAKDDCDLPIIREDLFAKKSGRSKWGHWRKNVEHTWAIVIEGPSLFHSALEIVFHPHRKKARRFGYQPDKDHIQPRSANRYLPVDS